MVHAQKKLFIDLTPFGLPKVEIARELPTPKGMSFGD